MGGGSMWGTGTQKTGDDKKNFLKMYYMVYTLKLLVSSFSSRFFFFYKKLYFLTRKRRCYFSFICVHLRFVFLQIGTGSAGVSLTRFFDKNWVVLMEIGQFSVIFRQFSVNFSRFPVIYSHLPAIFNQFGIISSQLSTVFFSFRSFHTNSGQFQSIPSYL